LYPYYNPSILLWIAIPAVIVVGIGLPVKGIPQCILTISYSEGINKNIQDDMIINLPLIVAIGIIIGIAQCINRF